MAIESMRRAATSAVIACLLGCPGRPPEAPRPALAADAELRIRIAHAEARRGGGLAELVELAARGTRPERLLALRALGRIGGAQALGLLRGALADRDPDVIGAAAAAIGVAASLDEHDAETAAGLTEALRDALPRAGRRAGLVLEALGRAGDAGAQQLLAAKLTGPTPRAKAAAIALGRHGRRKLALEAGPREALAAATAHHDAAVRYASVWALGREQLPDAAHADAQEVRAQAAVALALVARLDDSAPEIRAQAIAALTRRHRVEVAWRSFEGKLADPDWRVAVEAARALTGDQSDGVMRASAARGLAVRAGGLVRDGRDAQVVIEGLRGLVAHAQGETRPEDAAAIGAIAGDLAALAAGSALPVTTRGWIDCLARAAIARRTGADWSSLQHCGPREFPDHLRLPLLADLIKAKAGSPEARRDALRVLLSSPDVKVRAAGIGALAAVWPDGDEAEHRSLIATLAGAIGASDPILAGAAVDAAPAIYDLIGGGDHQALDAAVTGRAAREPDAELGASLFELTGKHRLAGGAAACRTGLGGAPVRARAAAACLAELGEPAPAGPVVAGASEPPVDVGAVIGRTVRWKLATNRGPVAIALSPDAAPWAVATIVALTRKGFYDGLEFHRVVPDFVVQGGDPTESGSGGPGFEIPAEPSDGTVSGFVTGGVGIADAGRDSGGSQWFVMHARAPHLDGRYTWIGRVVEGQGAADALQIGDRVLRATVEVAP